MSVCVYVCVSVSVCDEAVLVYLSYPYEIVLEIVLVTTHWSRKWQPTPIFLPGKFHGQRNLVGYSL